PLDAHVLQALRKPLDVVLESAERDIAEPLPRRFADRSPDMGLRKGAECQEVAAPTDVQAEFAVEILRNGKVGHREMEMIHRMNAKLARAAARPDVTVNRRHCASSFLRRPGHGQAHAAHNWIQPQKIFLSMKNNFSLLP